MSLGTWNGSSNGSSEPGGGRRIVHLRDRAVALELLGEHDLHTVLTLGPVLESLVDRNDLVIVDLTRAEFMDSSVLHELLRASRRMRERGGRLCLNLGEQPVVTKLFEITQLSEQFELVDGWSAALR
jgi:anti-sigma B factor antagonist